MERDALVGPAARNHHHPRSHQSIPPCQPGWRLHRLVVLPDYQGIGIGVSLADYVCSLYAATRKPVFRTMSHPAVIHHCAHSAKWRLVRGYSINSDGGRTGHTALNRTAASMRVTASFEYVGPSNAHDAERFGLLPVMQTHSALIAPRTYKGFSTL